MNELIGRLALGTGIGRVVAEKRAGIIRGFPCSENRSDKARISKANNTNLMRPGRGAAAICNMTHELSGFGRDTIGAGPAGEIIAGTTAPSQFA